MLTFAAEVIAQLREIAPARLRHALEHPVRRGGSLQDADGQNPYQRCFRATPHLGLSTIVTLDDLPEEQPPRWHASAALGKLIPTQLPTLIDLTPVRREALLLLCRLMLDGVGEGPDEVMVRVTQKTLHMRRALSAAELTAVEALRPETRRPRP